MALEYHIDVSELEKAFEDALGILGESTKQALKFHLHQKYDITFDGRDERYNCPSLEEIHYALRGILGAGASVLVKRMEDTLDEKRLLTR